MSILSRSQLDASEVPYTFESNVKVKNRFLDIIAKRHQVIPQRFKPIPHFRIQFLKGNTNRFRPPAQRLPRPQVRSLWRWR